MASGSGPLSLPFILSWMVPCECLVHLFVKRKCVTLQIPLGQLKLRMWCTKLCQPKSVLLKSWKHFSSLLPYLGARKPDQSPDQSRAIPHGRHIRSSLSRRRNQNVYVRRSSRRPRTLVFNVVGDLGKLCGTSVEGFGHFSSSNLTTTSKGTRTCRKAANA